MTSNQQKQLAGRAERLSLVVKRISDDASKWGLEDVGELDGAGAFLLAFASRLDDHDYSTRPNEKPRGAKLDTVSDENDDTPKPSKLGK